MEIRKGNDDVIIMDHQQDIPSGSIHMESNLEAHIQQSRRTKSNNTNNDFLIGGY